MYIVNHLIFVFFFLCVCVLGNAVLTCKSNDSVKVFTVRGTAFEAAKASGGGVASENGNELHLGPFSKNSFNTVLINMND